MKELKDKNDQIESSAVEDHNGILTIRGGGKKRSWNGIHYKQGMSEKNVGSTQLSCNVATIPPGGTAYAHIHDGFDLMLYILEGKVRHAFGPRLRQVLDNEAGDFIYIKPGVPHEVYNLSNAEPVVAFVARAAADEWDRIIPYDPDSAMKVAVWDTYARKSDGSVKHFDIIVDEAEGDATLIYNYGMNYLESKGVKMLI